MRRSLPPSLVLALLAWPAAAGAQEGPRARDLGVPFDGTPGPLNAITDVAGVEVGHATLVAGEGDLVIGEGPVRTGVTAVLPRGRGSAVPVFAAWFTLNGNGEMTGTTWVKDSGLMEGPVMITNTLSVGVVHHAVIRWGVERARRAGVPLGPAVAELPVVAETWDGPLNDIHGQHVTEADALRALESAAGGPVREGAVGGGTGMICNDFKGGIGTSSRVVEVLERSYVVGVLVQCNYGDKDDLRIAGVPVGRELPSPYSRPSPGQSGAASAGAGRIPAALTDRIAGAAGRDGSIIVVVATDAPVLPRQLDRIARRVSLGLGRLGASSSNSSGDIFIAFSTANEEAAREDGLSRAERLPNDHITPLFTATVQATEEAVVNALVAARTMTGADGLTVRALPHDRLREILARHGLMEEAPR